MEIERITTAVRPRSPWEAMDLGFHMVRRWWRALFAPWVLVLGGFAATIIGSLRSSPFTCLTLLWLCKPLYDRVPLYVLSRALFGAPPGWRESLAALPRLLRTDLGWTLVHRFDLVRSFDLPVRQLEGLRGAQARRRLRVLQKTARSHAAGMTGLFIILETICFISALWIIPMLLPEGVDRDLLELVLVRGTHEGWLPWALVGVYLFSILVLEPFYVAAGFALYLNRRTELEAWDVELQLRRLSHRLGSREVLAACLAGLICWTGLVPDRAWAGAPYEPPPVAAALRPETDSKTVIESVLANPLFQRYREVEVWRFRRSDGQDRNRVWYDLGIGRLLANLTETLLWVGLLVAVVLLLVHRKRWMAGLGWGRPPAPPEPGPPEILFGLNVRPESLPEDLPGTARGLLADGNAREALGLLYRGALAALTHGQGVPLSGSDTEGDCLRKINQRVDNARLHLAFHELTTLWREAAYAHRLPEHTRILALLEAWNGVFGGPG